MRVCARACMCVNIFVCAVREYINAQRSISGVVS